MKHHVDEKGRLVPAQSRVAKGLHERGPVKFTAYHGTKSNRFGEFNFSQQGSSDPGLVGRAVYLTPDREQARSFATSPHYGKGGMPGVITAQTGFHNPAFIDDGVLPDGRRLSEAHPNGITKASAAAVQRDLKKRGHDGAIFRSGGEHVQYAVFDPRNVRIIEHAFLNEE